MEEKKCVHGNPVDWECDDCWELVEELIEEEHNE